MTEKNYKLDYPRKTMYQLVAHMGELHPNEPAMDFYDRKTTYKQFVRKIDVCANALWKWGVRKGTVVTICMPNIPQAMISFYALDKIGAIANMIHPLSALNEIVYYLNISESRMIITPDMFYDKVSQAILQADHPVTILTCRMTDELPPVKAAAYYLKEGRKYRSVPRGNDLEWSKFMMMGQKDPGLVEAKYDVNRTAVILYSGGTSGKPKGIALSDLNFNACSIGAVDAIEERFETGLSMLSCMPCFHGFGLGINLHTVFIHGACSILMPSFNLQSYAKMLIKKKPNFIAGVPTLFDALLRINILKNADLSFLKGMFCGGDSLPVELKSRVDVFLKEHNASIQIREGYGLTECVTASCLTPKNEYRPHSIGLPFKDIEYRIIDPATDEILPANTEGEIVLSGPTVMLEYIKEPEETAKTLKKDEKGKVWLYSGDLGKMDEDGYIYFIQRMKRMIITNGYNVYPSVIEDALDKIPCVDRCCVIGVKDPKRMKRVRAYIVLKDGFTPDDATRDNILRTLEKDIAKYALPKEIIFREDLPKTLVGKVAYRKLEEEAEKEEA